MKSSVSPGRSFESLRKQFYMQETKTWSICHLNVHLFTMTMTHKLGVCKAYSLSYKDHFQCSFKARGRVNLSVALPRSVLISAPSYRTDISLFFVFNIQFPIHLCRWWVSTKLSLSKVRDAALTPQPTLSTWLFLPTSESTAWLSWWLKSLSTSLPPFLDLVHFIRDWTLLWLLLSCMCEKKLMVLMQLLEDEWMSGTSAIIGTSIGKSETWGWDHGALWKGSWKHDIHSHL